MNEVLDEQSRASFTPIRARVGSERDVVMPGSDEDPLEGSRETWIAAWTSDSVEALTRVYCRHFDAVLRRAANVCSVDDAADVAQEVFLRLWRAPQAFDPGKGSLRTYLLVLARGIAIDQVRRDVRRRARDERASTVPGPIDEFTMLEPLLAQESAARVHRALDQIHPAQRDAVHHVFFDELTFSDSARRTSVPESTVKSRVRLAMHRMRPELVDLARGDAA
jgi:RNA polymerase sigma-70 factor, ECF subfamily